MIISRTPYRISFFGGGTDYPEWYSKYGGQVLSSSIDKYVYISCRYLPPFFEHQFRLVYGKIELCNNINEIKHPSVRAVLKYLGLKKNLEIHYDGDLPARSGIGSSSAFTVGLLNSLYRYIGVNASKIKLAKESIKIEQNIIKETVGSQDQIGVTYGGLNHIKFQKVGNFLVKPLNISNNRIKSLEKKLMLFHTGIFRNAEFVTKSYVKNFKNKVSYLQNINSLTNEAINILKTG